MIDIRAILFDLDGVLVSFADCHFEALNPALEEVWEKPVLQSERDQFEGLSTRQKLTMMVQCGRVSPGAEDAIYRLKQAHTIRLAEERVEPDPIKVALCGRLKFAFRLACVSNCVRASVETLLEKSDLRRFMETTVSNEDVKNPKPAPDPYLLACQWLDVGPRETLAVEYHERGVQSAAAAGCHVVQLDYEMVYYRTVTQALDGLKKPKRGRRL